MALPALIENFVGIFKEMPPAKKIGVIGGGLVVFGLLLFFVFKSGGIDYQILFTNLNSDDAGAIVNRLKEQKIPYSIEDNGGTILVQSDKVHEARLQLALEGLPQGGGVGFEIFDKSTLGTTEFVQKLNYKRALQGELSRTISQLSEVSQTRVHLVIPEKSLFVEQEKVPTASVVLKLKPTRSLSKQQVAGIVHLVASAIEGLKPENVTVVDIHGNILSEKEEGSAIEKLSASQVELQRGLEKDYEKRLNSMLEMVVGLNKAVARVSLDLDFTQIQKTEEKFDPDSQVIRSEQHLVEKSSSPLSEASGVPGSQSNIPGSLNVPSQSQFTSATSEKTNDVVNYEISKVTSQTIMPVGGVKKISVAVLVDGKYEKVPGKEKGEFEQKYVPRTSEEMQKIESLVKGAIGFSQERGDSVSIQNIAFSPDPLEEEKEEMKKESQKEMYFMIGKYVLVAVGAVLFILLVVKPLLKALSAPRIEPISMPMGGLEMAVPKMPEEGEGEEAGVSVSLKPLHKPSGELDPEAILNSARMDVETTTKMVKHWVKEKKKE